MSRNGKRTVKKIVSLTFLLLYKLCTVRCGIYVQDIFFTAANLDNGGGKCYK